MDPWKKLPFFSSLSDKELAEVVVPLFQEERYREDEYLFYEGDPPQGLFILREGKVKIIKHSTRGKDTILRLLGPEEMFGEVASLDGGPYPASAQALEDTVVFHLSQRDFLRLLQGYPSIALRVIEDLGRKLRDAHDLIRALTTETVEKRIATVLLKLAEKLGKVEERGIRLRIHLSRQDLADMAGTTIETAIRVLSKFTKDRLLTKEGKNIIILDRAALAALSRSSLPR
ncbi:MAG TPA: Crp/Fnr family transcriptional regulator [Candidatus Methylomirabilis sp.]